MRSIFCSSLLLAILICAQHHAYAESIEVNEMFPSCLETFGLEELTIPEVEITAKKTCIKSTAYEGDRCFYTYVPECAGSDSPLVFELHGLGSCPSDLLGYSGWAQKATQNCFVYVIPHGNTNPDVAPDSCWAVPGGLVDKTVDDFSPSGCCCTEKEGPIAALRASDTDDAKFLRQVAAKVVEDVRNSTSYEVTIDTKRIYFAGHSNGCFTSTYMASIASDMVAAVACHAGGALAPFPSSYSPTPIMHINGNWDTLVPYDGGFLFRSLPDTHNILANVNGCTKTIEVVHESTKDKHSILTSSSCINDADVVLVTLDGVDHFPYAGIPGNYMDSLFDKEVEIDTTEMAWEFVKSYSLDVEPNLADYGDVDEMKEPEYYWQEIVLAVGGVIAMVAMTVMFIFF